MSLTAREVVASVRATLDYPDYGKLKPSTLLLKLREKVDHYLNRLNLTDRDWFLDDWTLTVDSSTDLYTVTATQWGRPVLCQTRDTSDPQHLIRDVRIVDYQDQNLFYEGPQTAALGTALGDKHSAVVMTFFRDSSDGLKVKVTPQPAQSADYIFYYEPNRPLPPTLSGNLQFLDQFNNLLVTDLALSCLPYCELDKIILSDGYYKKYTKADALKESLQRDFAIYLQTFEEYIQNDQQQRVQRKQMWGDTIVIGEDGWF